MASVCHDDDDVEPRQPSVMHLKSLYNHWSRPAAAELPMLTAAAVGDAHEVAVESDDEVAFSRLSGILKHGTYATLI